MEDPVLAYGIVLGVLLGMMIVNIIWAINDWHEKKKFRKTMGWT